MNLEKFFDFPKEALSYIEANEVPAPIEVREISLGSVMFQLISDKPFFDVLKDLINLALNEKFPELKDSPVIKAILKGDGYSFRCFVRAAPFQDENGEWIYPKQNSYERSTAEDAEKYVHEIGMEFDAVSHYCPKKGEWSTDAGFYVNHGEPLKLYMFPLSTDFEQKNNITYILIYRGDGNYKTPFLHALMQHMKNTALEEGKNFEDILREYNKIIIGTKTLAEHLDSPTLRDALVGVLKINWT